MSIQGTTSADLITNTVIGTADTIYGYAGADTLIGSNDTLYGGADGDVLVGYGAALVLGEDGDDTLQAFYAGVASGEGEMPERGEHSLF